MADFLGDARIGPEVEFFVENAQCAAFHPAVPIVVLPRVAQFSAGDCLGYIRIALTVCFRIECAQFRQLDVSMSHLTRLWLDEVPTRPTRHDYTIPRCPDNNSVGSNWAGTLYSSFLIKITQLNSANTGANR